MLGKTKNKYKYFLFAMVFVAAFFVGNDVANALDIKDIKTGNPLLDMSIGVSSGVASTPGEGLTDKAGGYLTGLAKEAVQGVLYEVFVFVGWLVSLAATMLGWVLSPALWGKDGFLEKEVVYQAWGSIRDLFNMFFILMLLFSAFSTIFQVEKFNIKKIFLSMLLAVLLINFSFPITRVIIDISNVMMFSFLNGMSGLNIVANFADYANIGDVLVKPANLASYPIPYLIASIIFVFIFAITLLVLAIMLMIRLIELMGLIMFSPIGFAGSVLPGMGGVAGKTGGLSRKWWDALFRNAFFGPFMALTLMFAGSIMASKEGEAKNPLLVMATRNAPAGDGEHFALWLAQAAYYAIPIIILWLGMGIAKSMSTTGAGAVVGAGEKFGKWTGSMLTTKPAGLAWKGTKMAAGAGVKKFERDILGEKLSPRAWIKGWKERSAEVDNQFLNKATGGARDSLNMLFEGAKTDYRQLAIDKEVAERRKEMAASTEHTSYWFNQLKGSIGKKSERAVKDFKAFAGNAYKNRDQDEIMQFVRENYENPILFGGKSFKDIGIKEDELGVSGWNVDQVVSRVLEASGENSHQINKTVLDLGEVGAGGGGVGYGGADYNGAGNLVGAKNKVQQATATVAKLATVGEVQKLAQMTHRNNIVDEVEYVDEDGDTVMGINPEFDQLVAQGLLVSMKSHANRHNGSFYKWVGKDSAVLGMKKRLEKLMKEGVDTWDDKTQKIVKQKLDPEFYKGSNEWIDVIQDIRNTGKKAVHDEIHR